MQMGFKRKSISCLLAACLAFSWAGPGFSVHSPQFLAPRTQAPFLPKPPTQDQLKNLLNTLNLVIAFLESQQEEINNYITDGVEEDSSFVLFLDPANPNESLIPELLFLNALGLPNLEALRDSVRDSLQEGRPLARKGIMKVGISLHAFARLTANLVGCGVFTQLKLSPYDRNKSGRGDSHSTPRLTLVISNYDRDGRSAFTVTGSNAEKVYKILFPDKKTQQERLVRWMKQTTAAQALQEALKKLIWALQQNEPVDTTYLKEMVFLKAESVLDPKQKQKLRNEIERIKGVKRLQEIVEMINHQMLIIGAENKRMNQLNLAAIVGYDSRCIREIGIAVREVELDLYALFGRLGEIRTHEKIIAEILFRLLDGKCAGKKEETEETWVEVDAFLVQLARAVNGFPREAIQNRKNFYYWIKILAATEKAVPFTGKSDQNIDHVLKLRAHILNALQEHFPGWVQESLNFLDEEATFQEEIDFLKATGWIDEKTDQDLDSWNPAHLANFKKEILQRLERLQKMNYYPESADLSQPEERRAAWDYFQSKIFLSGKPFKPETTLLAFLKREQFERAAKKAGSWGQLKHTLAEAIVHGKILQAWIAYYRKCQQSQKEPGIEKNFLEWLAYADITDMASIWNIANNPPEPDMEPWADSADWMRNLKWALFLLRPFFSSDTLLVMLKKAVLSWHYMAAIEDLAGGLPQDLNRIIRDLAKNKIQEGNFSLLDLVATLSQIIREAHDPMEDYLLSVKAKMEAGGPYEALRALVTSDLLAHQVKIFQQQGIIERIRSINLWVGELALSYIERTLEAIRVELEETHQEALDNLGETFPFSQLDEIPHQLSGQFWESFRNKCAFYPQNPFVREILLRLDISTLMKEALRLYPLERKKIVKWEQARSRVLKFYRETLEKILHSARSSREAWEDFLLPPKERMDILSLRLQSELFISTVEEVLALESSV